MIDLPEPGYTPANLKALLKQAGLTYEQGAALLGVSFRAMQRWCTAVGSKQHRDMPLEQWRRLLTALDRED